MGINMNIGMQNNYLNVSSTNHGIKYNTATPKNTEKYDEKDSISISILGKASNRIESLMEQKQNIIDTKNELISMTLEKGRSMENIKSQLDSYDEQLENIDEQISQIITEQFKKQVEDKKEMIYKKPETKEELENEKLNSMVNLSTSLNKIQMISSVKMEIDGEARVLEVEIKLDESRQGGASAFKKERLHNLRKQSGYLNIQIKEDLVKVTEKNKENNGHPIEAERIEELNSNSKNETEYKDIEYHEGENQ